MTSTVHSQRRNDVAQSSELIGRANSDAATICAMLVQSATHTLRLGAARVKRRTNLSILMCELKDVLRKACGLHDASDFDGALLFDEASYGVEHVG